MQVPFIKGCRYPLADFGSKKIGLLLRFLDYLYVLLLFFAGFSWVFGVRGDFCMCFCWLLLAFLGFLASAAIFVCAFAGFCWLFLVFWRPRRFLYVLFLAFVGLFGVRSDFVSQMLGFVKTPFKRKAKSFYRGGEPRRDPPWDLSTT